jgi:hypothetical protein
MKALAEKEDQLMDRLRLPHLSPKLAERKGVEYWMSQPNGPKAEIKDRGKAITINYDEMLKRWSQNELK